MYVFLFFSFVSFFFNFDLSSLSYSTLSSFHILPQYNITLTEKKHFLCCLLSVYITFIKMHIYPNSSSRRKKKHNAHVLYSHMLCITSSFTSFKASLVNTVVGTVVYSHVVTAATGAVLFHGTFATACWLLLRYIATSLVSAYYNIVGCWNDIYTEIYMQTIHILNPSPCMYICRYIHTA